MIALVRVPIAATQASEGFFQAVWGGVTQQLGVTVVLVVWAALLWPARVLNRRYRPARPAVYLSATPKDLGTYRDAANQAILDAGGRPFGDAAVAARRKPSMKKRYDQIDACDLFIGLYAWQYGELSGTGSVTSLELERARTSDRRRHLWVVPGDASWPQDRVDASRDAVEGRRRPAGGERRAAHHAVRAGAVAAMRRDVERAVVGRIHELQPDRLRIANLTSASAVMLAGAVGLLGSASQVLQAWVAGGTADEWVVGGTGGLAALACYAVRYLYIRTV